MSSKTSLTIAAARQILFETLSPVTGWECVPVRQALGRVLFNDVVAPFDVPAHTNSAMDGYAVRIGDLSQEGETRLAVIGTAFAGNAFTGVVGAG